jgi:hypothetical protein
MAAEGQLDLRAAQAARSRSGGRSGVCIGRMRVRLEDLGGHWVLVPGRVGGRR